MGATDPNYSNPPACWIRKPSSLYIVGVPTNGYAATSPTTQAAILGGSSSNTAIPGVQLSGDNNGFGLENVGFQYTARGIVLSEDSNGVYSSCNRAGSSSITIDNVAVNTLQVPGNGPALTVGGCTFWLTIKNSTFVGNDGVNTATNDDAAAILFVAGADGASSSANIENVHLVDGGIKYHAGTQGVNNLVASNIESEGQHGPALIWIADGSAPGQFNFSNLQVNDPIGTLCQGTVCSVENDETTISPEDLLVTNSSDANKGPMLLMGANTLQSGSPSTCTGTPYVNSQEGFVNGCIYANTDAARRLFGPTAVPVANSANTLPSSWVLPPGVTITTGIAAPDGTTGAGRTTYSGPGSSGPNFYGVVGGTNLTVSVGQWFIAGVWARLNSGTSWNGNSQGQISITGCSITFSGSNLLGGTPNDGSWAWTSTAIKVLTVSRNPCQVQFQGRNGGHNADQTDYYAPVFLNIAAGSMADAEVQMIYRNLESYPSNAPVGSISGLPGQEWAFPGTTAFLGLMTQSNTANRTYTFPDASGTVALTNLAQNWSATQTLDSPVLTDPTIDGQKLDAPPIASFSAFLPGALSTPYTASVFTPDYGIVVTRIEVTLKTPSQGCNSSAVVSVQQGSNGVDLPIPLGTSDSGPLSLQMEAGNPVEITLSTPAQGCSTPPQDANVVVHYRMQ